MGRKGRLGAGAPFEFTRKKTLSCPAHGEGRGWENTSVSLLFGNVLRTPQPAKTPVQTPLEPGWGGVVRLTVSVCPGLGDTQGRGARSTHTSCPPSCPDRCHVARAASAPECRSPATRLGHILQKAGPCALMTESINNLVVFPVEKVFPICCVSVIYLLICNTNLKALSGFLS